MGELTISIFPVLMAQAASQLLLALLLVVLFHRFHRAYRHSYLHHWALSWLAFAVQLVGVAASEGTRGIDPREPRLVVFALALVAGYLQIAWFLLGVWELAREVDARRSTVVWALAGAVAVALASVISVLGGQATGSLLGLRSVIAGVSYLAAAATIALTRRLLTLGRAMAGLALVLYAADQFAFALSFPWGSAQRQVLPLVMSFDVVAVAMLGLALVVWLLEGERERLERASELTRRRERVQACVYAISEAARTVRDLPQLYRSIHDSLQAVLPARNFYVAVYDRSSGLVSFPYFADEHDPVPPARALGRGLTEYVLRTGRPLLATPEVIEDLHARGETVRVIRGRVDWLGAPLLERGQPIGVAAIQTHDPAVRLGPAERDLFVFVAEQIASAIEAKRAEEALRQSEARLRMVMEQVPALLWTTDEQLRFTTAVGAGLRDFGLQSDEVVGRSVREIVSAESAALKGHEQALAGVSASYDHEMGGRSYVAHVEPLRDAEGRTQGTIGIAQDLSEKRKADRALRESEARLRQVMDLVPHFIFAKDEEGRFLLANRAVAEAYGTTVEELVGRRDADFAQSEAEVRHFLEDDLEVIRSGRPKVVSEEPITDSRGRVRYLQTTKIPFAFSGTGRPAILGVSIDITEHKAADEALLRAAKEESLSVLAGGIAHDFNNLLAAILGHASLALKQLSTGSPARHHVEKAAAAVERASDLTRQMLAYSGRGHFVVLPTDINALVRENLPLLQVAVPKNVRLEGRLDGRLPPVDADVGQIQQVLMNLVINAGEAIGERGGTVTVATGVRQVGPGTARCGVPAGSRSRRARTSRSRSATTDRAWSRRRSIASSSPSSRRRPRAAAWASRRCSGSCGAIVAP